MIEILYSHIISTRADIAMCDFFPTKEGKDDQRKNTLTDYSVSTFTNEQVLQGLYEKGHTYVVPWNKLYRKKIFTNVKYPSGYLYDDEFTAHKVLFQADKTVYIHVPLYFYVIRKGSTTHRSEEHTSELQSRGHLV